MAAGDRLTTVVTTTAKNIDFNADGGAALVDLNIAAAWDGVVDFQGTFDGVNYFNIAYLTWAVLDPSRSISQLTSLATARYLLPGPLTQVRIKCGAGTVGSLTAIYRIVPLGEDQGGAFLPPPKSAIISASAAGATQVVAAVTGKKICPIGYVCTAAGSVNWKFQSAGTDKTGLLYHGGKGEGEAPVAPPGAWLWEGGVNEALNINLSGAVAVGGHLQYVERV